MQSNKRRGDGETSGQAVTLAQVTISSQGLNPTHTYEEKERMKVRHREKKTMCEKKRQRLRERVKLKAFEEN